MADRTKTETGDQQKTYLSRDKTGGGLGYSDKENTPEQDRAIHEAQAKNIGMNRQDQGQEKLPTDPNDPDSNRKPGLKNPHER